MRRLVPLLVISLALAACPETNERSGEDTGFVSIDANLPTPDAARERRDAFVPPGADVGTDGIFFMEEEFVPLFDVSFPGDTGPLGVDAAFPPGEDAFVSFPDAALPRDAGITRPDASAGRCGSPGEACCDFGESCTGGGCCDVDHCVPSGVATSSGDVCRAGMVASCGAPGEPCCGTACEGAGCCVNGRCAGEGSLCGRVATCTAGSCTTMGFTCGGVGQPCCPSTTGAPFCTVGGLACTGGIGARCEPCGGPGQPCCEGQACDGGGCCAGETCVGEGSECPMAGGTCIGGGCEGGTCGFIGGECCGAGTGCTAPYSVCIADVCGACGGSGQPCCGTSCGAPFTCRRSPMGTRCM